MVFNEVHPRMLTNNGCTFEVTINEIVYGEAYTKAATLVYILLF